MTEDLVILKLNEIWDCDIPFGWIPISGDRPIPDTEVYQQFHFATNISNLADIIADTYNVTDLYEIQEGGTVRLKKLMSAVLVTTDSNTYTPTRTFVLFYISRMKVQ